MKLHKTLSAIAITGMLTIPLVGCAVEQTEEGEMPEVEMQAEGGNLPEYDVDAADVEVGTEPATIEVPDVDVSTEEETVNLPDVDIEPPADDNEPPSNN